jgi:hypothetical protein
MFLTARLGKAAPDRRVMEVMAKVPGGDPGSAPSLEA